MKKLVVERGASFKQYKTTEGDVYTDMITLYGDSGMRLLISQYGNSDPSVRYKGKSGVLAAGKYYGIVGYRWNEEKKDWSGKRVIKVFHKDVPLVRIHTHADLSDDDMTVPSKIPNPNWGGKPILKYVQVHDGGDNWDWSQGCITLLNNGPAHDYDLLKTVIKDNEILEIEVIEGVPNGRNG